MDNMSELERAKALRNCLGSFVTGVTVVTTRDANNNPRGLVVNSFASVSLNPPLVSWNLALGSPSLDAFMKSGAFAVNIMSHGSEETTMRFARSVEDKFDGVDWHAAELDLPILNDAMATLICETDRTITLGDHEMFVGRVLKFNEEDMQPLVFHRGAFTALADTAEVA
ncbi:MAG: flavin reductase family protein [Hoeflea sp.]